MPASHAAIEIRGGVLRNGEIDKSIVYDQGRIGVDSAMVSWYKDLHTKFRVFSGLDHHENSTIFFFKFSIYDSWFQLVEYYFYFSES